MGWTYHAQVLSEPENNFFFLNAVYCYFIPVDYTNIPVTPGAIQAPSIPLKTMKLIP